MAGIITKNEENHPEHAVYKAREKSRAVEAEKVAAAAKPAEKTPEKTPEKPTTK
jgi:hypothetical protein